MHSDCEECVGSSTKCICINWIKRSRVLLPCRQRNIQSPNSARTLFPPYPPTPPAPLSNATTTCNSFTLMTVIIKANGGYMCLDIHLFLSWGGGATYNPLMPSLHRQPVLGFYLTTVLFTSSLSSDNIHLCLPPLSPANFLSNYNYKEN